MKPGVGNSKILATQTAAIEITGTKLKTTGAQEITFKVGNKRFTNEFLYLPWIQSIVEYSGSMSSDIWRRGSI
jgi:hypothetical protein